MPTTLYTGGTQIDNKNHPVCVPIELFCIHMGKRSWLTYAAATNTHTHTHMAAAALRFPMLP
jgi:hypothetical protein